MAVRWASAMTPTREAGLARLAAFIPLMGAACAARRDDDAGPGAREAVSGLSPWLAHRLLTEEEVIAAAIAAHGAAGVQGRCRRRLGVCGEMRKRDHALRVGRLDRRPARQH